MQSEEIGKSERSDYYNIIVVAPLAFFHFLRSASGLAQKVREKVRARAEESLRVNTVHQ